MINSEEEPAISERIMNRNCQLTMRLLQMLQRTNYNLVQENGQRRLTAPEVTRGEVERVKGAEVFIGRLPRDCYEDELTPILEKIGRLLELRLMLDFSGSTRGFAFALYEDQRTAKKACMELNGYEIRPGHKIGVVKSVDNCRLFFGGVPKNKRKEDFIEELSKVLDGIIDVYIYPSAQDRNLNRGFIFVEFKDHRAAAMARRKLIPGRVMLWDHEIAVDWADPEPGDPTDDETMQTVTALFVRNLSISTPQQTIKDIFQRTTNIPIIKLKKINHFAFIHYETRKDAQAVMDIMTVPNGVADREGWEIRWAKPIGTKKLAERQKCINEAIAAGSKEQKKENQKDRAKKRYAKSMTYEISKMEHIDYDKLNNDPVANVNVLKVFLKEKFGSTCTVECLPSLDTTGFRCKISIFQGHKLLFNYYGDPMPFENDSVINACINLLGSLNSIFAESNQAFNDRLVRPLLNMTGLP